MIIAKKFRTANRIFEEEGLLQLIRKTLIHLLHLLKMQFLFPQLSNNNEVNEGKLVYEILDGHRRQGVMIDVGAHWGSALRPFAESKWQIYAFEPDLHNRQKLQTQFGGFDNVSIDPRALSDKEQENIDFFTSRQSSGISGLSAFHVSHENTQKVNTTTLKKVINSFDITTVDFLKVDTEGFDLFVLKGMPWDNIVPEVILCEFEDAKTIPLGYGFHVLARFLVDKGYVVMVSEWYPVVEYGGNHRWKRFIEYPCELDDDKGWGNFIAVKGEVHTNRLRKFCLNDQATEK